MHYLKDIQLLERIDSYILKGLFDSLICGNLYYCHALLILRQLEEDIPIELREGLDLRKRFLYLSGLGYIEFEPLLSIDEAIDRASQYSIDYKKFITGKGKYRKIDSSKYHDLMLFSKITSSGIHRLEELEKNIESRKGIKGKILRLKKFLSSALSYKYAAGAALSGICIILIFVFDIKVTAYISKLPILSSILDMDMLKKFEQVNKEDEYFKQLQKDLNLDPSKDLELALKASSDGNSGNDINPSQMSNSGGNSSQGKINFPFVDKIRSKVGDFEIKMLRSGENERQFRVIGKDGDIENIIVKKLSDGTFQTIIPSKLKDILKK